MLLAASILGLGDSPSSGGQTLALALTFLGIGIIVNLLIAYAVLQALGEHRQNQERMRRLRERQ
jgi:HD-like signal output (HDOD) protein